MYICTVYYFKEIHILSPYNCPKVGVEKNNDLLLAEGGNVEKKVNWEPLI